MTRGPLARVASAVVVALLAVGGTVFYVLTVAPRDCVSDYEDTFRRIVDSIQIVDCDRCVQ